MKKNDEIKNLINLITINKDTLDFIKDNDLTDDEIIKNFSKFSLYNETIANCNNCDGTSCNNDPYELVPTLAIDAKRRVKIVYEDCMKSNSSKASNLEVIHYTENNIDYEITPSRIKLLKEFDRFVKDYQEKKNKTNVKGIYLFGKCGVGKSLLMYRFANNLSKLGYKVIFAYYPDLVREFQNSFGSPNLERLIVKLKQVDILILDDMARESNTPYIRDEILGPILQYRCDNNLPMFVTSNRSFNDMEKHLAETSQVYDHVKAKALIERFKYLMKEYEISDKDYRNNN